MLILKIYLGGNSCGCIKRNEIKIIASFTCLFTIHIYSLSVLGMVSFLNSMHNQDSTFVWESSFQVLCLSFLTDASLKANNLRKHCNPLGGMLHQLPLTLRYEASQKNDILIYGINTKLSVWRQWEQWGTFIKVQVTLAVLPTEDTTVYSTTGSYCIEHRNYNHYFVINYKGKEESEKVYIKNTYMCLYTHTHTHTHMHNWITFVYITNTTL